MESFIDPAAVNYNKDYSLIYVDPFNSKFLAMNLLTFGITQFKRSKRVIEFQTFSDLQKNKKISEIYEFAICNINDTIRISICFENFMKAILLVNNYMVHTIKNDENFKSLFKKQKEEPVSVVEVRKIKEFEFTGRGEVKAVLPGIINKTIGMGTMLSSKYQKLINLPINVFKIVSAINEYRNNLHFYVKEDLLINPKDIQELEILIEFVEYAIIPLYKNIDALIIENGKSQLK